MKCYLEINDGAQLRGSGKLSLKHEVHNISLVEVLRVSRRLLLPGFVPEH